MSDRRLLALLLVLCVTVRGAPADNGPWQAGYAEADITPAPGQCMMYGFGRERYARGTLAPLLTQVVVLRDTGGRTAVLITADLLEFDRVAVEAIRLQRHRQTQRHLHPD